jgi:hypothetical protein
VPRRLQNGIPQKEQTFLLYPQGGFNFEETPCRAFRLSLRPARSSQASLVCFIANICAPEFALSAREIKYLAAAAAPDFLFRACVRRGQIFRSSSYLCERHANGQGPFVDNLSAQASLIAAPSLPLSPQ